MDTFQVTSLVLLSVITMALIAWLIIGYKSIVRRDVAARALQAAVDGLLPRLIEVEATLKSHLPALERSSGDSGKHLVEMVGHLRTMDQTNSKLVRLNEELNALAAQLKDGSDTGVSTARSVGESTSTRLVELTQQLIELRKQFDEVTKF